ncbi:MAG: DmsC/YnfH family molybdoenzyme membrane anchor subunit [Chloroflexota bacterium]
MEVREWALPVYTILMQLAAGSLLSLWLIRWAAGRRHGYAPVDQVMRIPLLAILVTIVVAILGSHFHLSRPHLSLLAVLNLRTSWLSREILFTIVFFLAVSGLVYLHWFSSGYPRLKMALGWVGIVSGVVSVYCMAMIYLLPTQTMWNSPLTVISFLMTAVLLGVTAVAVLIVMDLKVSEIADTAGMVLRAQIIRRSFIWLALVGGITAVSILLLNLSLIAMMRQGDLSALTSIELLLGLYRPLFILRYFTLFAGVGWFALTAFLLYRRPLREMVITTPVYLSCLLVLIGEILGRFLFYATHVRLGL